MSVDRLAPLYLDLELTRGDKPHLQQVGLWAPTLGRQEHWQFKKGGEPPWRLMDELARGCMTLVTHNGRRHDIPWLLKFAPPLSLLRLPHIDTLELSPLGFPRNPYHRLLKDYKLIPQELNDPLGDCKSCASLLGDVAQVFSQLPAPLLGVYRGLFHQELGRDYEGFFEHLGAPAFYGSHLEEALTGWLLSAPNARVCPHQVSYQLGTWLRDPTCLAPLRYLLAWLTTVEEGTSVVPTWVHRQHPTITRLIKNLRGTHCGDNHCPWCGPHLSARGALKRFFDFDDFRGEIKDPSRSVQREVVTHLLGGDSVLAILPTGGGKSLCYQLPALMWAEQGKRLTVIISPLQSLMKDQVDNLQHRNFPNVAALYSGLTPLERKRVLDGVRLGNIDVLLVAPEQLRNRSFRNVVEQRSLAAWIVDEAHCLTKWGHDFRPDYLYLARFIKELADEQRVEIPPVGCFTATARKEVVDEIRDYFHKELGLNLIPVEGALDRPNLSYQVREVSPENRHSTILEHLGENLRQEGEGSAIIYVNTRNRCDEVAAQLKASGWKVESYHAGKALDRPQIQERFISGEVPVIVATNAFGMGVDKADVRLVIHANIPGSLEAYLQEAGRAGRDRRDASCVLLYQPRDVESQFQLQGSNRITPRVVQEILRSLRKKGDRLKVKELQVTSGEILREPDIKADIDLKDRQYDTKVRAALLVLEQADLVKRGDNQYQIFEGKLQIKTLEDGLQKLRALNLQETTRQQAEVLIGCLWGTRGDELLNTDTLADTCGVSHEEVVKLLGLLRDAGLTTQCPQFSALVRVGTTDNSRDRFVKSRRLESELMGYLLTSPDIPADAGPGGLPLTLRVTALTHYLRQHRGTEGEALTPEEVRRLVYSLRTAKLWSLTRSGRDRLDVTLAAERLDLRERSRRRLTILGVLVPYLISPPKTGTQKGDLKVTFTSVELLEALRLNFETRALDVNEGELCTCLLFLHDQKILELQGGLAVLRPAMNLNLGARGKGFSREDFRPLEELYTHQVEHIHVMEEYARLALTAPEAARNLMSDYFVLDHQAFLAKYFPERGGELKLSTRAETYQRIVEALGDEKQRGLVTSQKGHRLVLAGPGSGKTRIIVHRVAYLVMIERVPPDEILVLSFNRSVAREIRRRLMDLFDERVARRVLVQTYHSLSLMLVGRDLGEEIRRGVISSDGGQDRRTLFDQILRDATLMLVGQGQLEEGAEEHREKLQGIRYLLVDEYQDVSEAQYALLRALTGLHLADAEDQLQLLAVGDDDQSIYKFAGARVEYIRKFQHDYKAEVRHLLTNFRSTQTIVEASQALIRLNSDRMKADLNLTALPGAKGPPVRVVRVKTAVYQFRWVVDEIARWLADGVLPGDMVVLARHHQQLATLEVMLGARGILCQRRGQQSPPFHRLRSVRRVLDVLENLRGQLPRIVDFEKLILDSYGQEVMDPEGQELLNLVGDLRSEVGDAPTPPQVLIGRIYDREGEVLKVQSAQPRVLLSTLHAAKGLEFNRVVMIPEARSPDAIQEVLESEEERRLFYVGMTRARQFLTVMDSKEAPSPQIGKLCNAAPARSLQEVEPEVILEAGDMELAALKVEDLGLTDVWTSAPAWGVGLPMGRTITRLHPGDPLTLELRKGKIFIRAEGIEVGQLSEDRRSRWLTGEGQWKVEIQKVEVAAIVVMDRKEGEDLPHPRWEVVLPRVWFRVLRR